jgi:LmbE family N-acetylglucosaminyl deacetylase
MPKNQDSAVIVFKENDKTRDRKRCLRPWFIWPVALAWLALGLSGCSVSPTDLHASDAVDPVIMSRPHRFAQSRIRPEHELPATIFYVGAHPDDIELFMGVQVVQDFIQQPQAKKVFIVTTAGDAGYGAGNGESDRPYWVARRLGHESAVLFMLSMTGVNAPNLKVDKLKLGKHTVERRAFGSDIVMYNLSLPDGGRDGGGYPATGRQSLKNLVSGAVLSIDAVDGSNHFTLAELQMLLSELIANESQGARWVQINLSEDRDDLNPADHPDHVTTSRLIQGVLAPKEPVCMRQTRFATYANTFKAQNVTSDELMVHAATWGAINIGRAMGHQRTSWGAAHNAWLGKLYPTSTSTTGTDCRP